MVPRGIRFSVSLERRVAAAETAAWEERTMRRLQAAQTQMDELEEDTILMDDDVHWDEARRWFSRARDPAQFDWPRYQMKVPDDWPRYQMKAQTLDERRKVEAIMKEERMMAHAEVRQMVAYLKEEYLERAMALTREREEYEKEKETRRVSEEARKRRESDAAAKAGEQNSDGARGYVLEIFSGHFELPNLGLIGANGGGGGRGGYYTQQVTQR